MPFLLSVSSNGCHLLYDFQNSNIWLITTLWFLRWNKPLLIIFLNYALEKWVNFHPSMLFTLTWTSILLIFVSKNYFRNIFLNKIIFLHLHRQINCVLHFFFSFALNKAGSFIRSKIKNKLDFEKCKLHWWIIWTPFYLV